MTKEELKQEAKEYADKYSKSNFDIWDTARFAYYQSAEPREKRIAELEKENAELKSFKQDCIKLTEDNVVMARQRAETARQLTKAKEIIRAYKNICNYAPFLDEKEMELKDKAEQFLSEVEK